MHEYMSIRRNKRVVQAALLSIPLRTAVHVVATLPLNRLNLSLKGINLFLLGSAHINLNNYGVGENMLTSRLGGLGIDEPIRLGGDKDAPAGLLPSGGCNQLRCIPQSRPRGQ